MTADSSPTSTPGGLAAALIAWAIDEEGGLELAQTVIEEPLDYWRHYEPFVLGDAIDLVCSRLLPDSTEWLLRVAHEMPGHLVQAFGFAVAADFAGLIPAAHSCAAALAPDLAGDFLPSALLAEVALYWFEQDQKPAVALLLIKCVGVPAGRDRSQRIVTRLVDAAVRVVSDDVVRAALTRRVLLVGRNEGFGEMLSPLVEHLSMTVARQEAEQWAAAPYNFQYSKLSPLVARVWCDAAPGAMSAAVVKLLDSRSEHERRSLILEALMEPADELLAAISIVSAREAVAKDLDPRTADLSSLLAPVADAPAFALRNARVLRNQCLLLYLAQSFARQSRFARVGDLHDIEELWLTAPREHLLPVIDQYVETAMSGEEELLLSPLVVAATANADLRLRIEALATDASVGGQLTSRLRSVLVLSGAFGAAEEDAYSAVESVASWMKFRDEPPAPLAAPSATWITDAGIERTLRSAVARAARRMMNWSGRVTANEEALTPQLAGLVREALNGERMELSARGITLTATDYPTKKDKEKVVGADVALVIDVQAKRWLKGKWVSFVQVKLDPATGKSPWWSIEREQLKKLLHIDPGASYWLFDRLGQVHVVPAKFLFAMGASRPRRKKPGEKPTFTIHYRQVRSAAIGLDGFFVDLLAGSWLGSSAAAAIEIAESRHATVRAKRVISLKVEVGKVVHDDRWPD